VKTPFEERLLNSVIADRYRLVQVHARGAFGTVFRAEQFFCRQFVRLVAVKVSRQTGLTETTAPRLFNDALILARLLAGGSREGRQHLAPILDMGLLPDCDGRGFLVTEFVDGLPLLAHVKAAGRLGVAAGLRHVKDICRGLAAVHAQGAAHRDLKPDNVLIDRAGGVRLVDFGLASFADPRPGAAPAAHGAYTYLAPETLLGRSTPAADVYGLGLLMYELFTGGGPHLAAPWPDPADDPRLDDHLRIKQTLQFQPPSEVQPDIRHDHRWLDALILRCLDNAPGQRFRDAGRLLEAIETCESGGDLPPPDPDAAEPPTDAAEDPGRMPPPGDDNGEDLVRDARRLLSRRAFADVVDRLDIHRPAEWVTLDLRGARILRLLGQAFIGRGDLRSARECLEQLRSAQQEQGLLSRLEFAAVLTDLLKCHRGLGLDELAARCQEEVKQLRG
jgi:serine/threonine-protein kinase